MTADEVIAAFAEFMELLASAGLPYVACGSNMPALSPMGSVKSTYAVPATMAPALKPLKTKIPAFW
jgi:hypothetical protein